MNMFLFMQVKIARYLLFDEATINFYISSSIALVNSYNKKQKFLCESRS